jgi:MoxR-like ATPase
MSDRLSEDVARFQSRVTALRAEVGKVLVGQEDLVQRLLLGLLAGGHVLLEGVPGLAKTLVIRTLADALDGTFSRIQFTPDMLPGDVVGTQIYNPREGTYAVKKGPVFGNFVLADEINRAPAKVQSALLEAMQERQVTLGEHTFKLADPFSGAGDPEPDRAGGHVSAARGPARSLHAEDQGRLSEQGRRGQDPRPLRRHGAASRAPTR